MQGTASPTPMDASEYDAIEAAFRETERGRWFLVEHARRNRGADTDTLLVAIARLENAVVTERETEGVGRLRGDLMEMAEAIARTKAEIAALSAPEQDQSRLTLASEALDAIVRATERATSDILGAAEAVQETAWTLREQGIDLALCDELDRRATLIYTACSFQDLTAQRTSRIVHTLRYLEERIASMIGIWGARIDEIPAAPDGEAARIPAAAAPAPLDQTAVDRFLDMDAGAPDPSPAASRLASTTDLTFVPDDIGWGEPASDAAGETVETSEMSAEADTTPEAETDAAFAEAGGDVAAGAEIGTEDVFAFAEPEADIVPDAAGDDASVDAVAVAASDAKEQPDAGSAPVEAAAKPAKRAPSRKAAKTQTDDLSIAFADLDRLSIEEKIALFS